jgi:protein-tyrosine phosphatase
VQKIGEDLISFHLSLHRFYVFVYRRYRHVWPFEHARVRLHQRREADDDYVNASYIQPLVTTKRYIATQGPLPATFTDFWT